MLSRNDVTMMLVACRGVVLHFTHSQRCYTETERRLNPRHHLLHTTTPTAKQTHRVTHQTNPLACRVPTGPLRECVLLASTDFLTPFASSIRMGADSTQRLDSGFLLALYVRAQTFFASHV